MATIKLLTFTTLYPNTIQPNHGIFVENRLRHLLKTDQVKSIVVAPVPWFPVAHRLFGGYGQFARIPYREERNGITVLHPQYPVLPKIGMAIAPVLMTCALTHVLRKIALEYPFDIIDAHYFYPDGVAAVALGKILAKPVVVTARGTDLNLLPKFFLPRKQIQWAAQNSAAIITVCQALKDVLVNLGVEDAKIRPLRNGVNLDLFHPPENRELLRKRLGVSGPTILSVGQLIKRKGHDIVIQAISSMPTATLLIAGDGPERVNLQQLALHLGIKERVKFLGSAPHNMMNDYYGAADVLALASSREGWANVLLEAMACGTPVVASKIWGTPEVVCSPEAGILVEPIAPDNFAKTLTQLFATPPDREDTRKYAERFSWDATTQGQLHLFNTLLADQVQ